MENGFQMKKGFLTLFYITNNPNIARVAEKYGVDRIWIDLETLGKEKRQKNMDTVKSHHSISDIKRIKPVLSSAEVLVRVNPWNDNSEQEIESVVKAGADIIMLPFWKSKQEVELFLSAVDKRAKTVLLLETKEAVEITDEILEMGGYDEIHIGLNDLHLSYGMKFMFELLSEGHVESLCNKFRQAGIPYGFGGIAKLGGGMLPAEKIIKEHYRLGSTRAILSRAFCDCSKIDNIDMIEREFRNNLTKLIEFENTIPFLSEKDLLNNKKDVEDAVSAIVASIMNKQE